MFEMDYNFHVFVLKTAVIFTLLTLALGQFYDPNSPSINKTDPSIEWGEYIYCACSPTDRGFSQDTLETFNLQLKVAQEIVERARSRGVRGVELGRIELREALNTIEGCRVKHKNEACVNVDETRRSEKKHICAYHKPTGLNVHNYTKTSVKYVIRCNQHSTTSSPPEFLGPQFQKSTPSPSPAEEKKIKGDTPVDEKSAPQPIDNVCVAIEHLKGYVLQHRKHIMSTVLCSRGFCATPHHLIIINGKRTSMKLLCSTGEWKCTWTTKLVNNLKIAANTRALVGDIVVTPYDIRYPVPLIWAVQIAEDILDLVYNAAISGLLSTTLLYIWVWFQNTMGVLHKDY